MVDFAPSNRVVRTHHYVREGHPVLALRRKGQVRRDDGKQVSKERHQGRQFFEGGGIAGQASSRT